MEDLNHKMSLNLKAARVKANFTQEQAANCLGIDRSTYHEWEKNPTKIPISKLYDTCQLYGVEIRSLM